MVPLRFGSAEDFARLRAILTGVGYTEPEICARTGCRSIYHFRTTTEGRPAPAGLRDAVDALIRLFLDIETVERDAAEALLPSGGLGVMQRLGLLHESSSGAGRLRATVLLYPVESLYICSDLNRDPETGREEPLPDAVYPAITTNTESFLASLPTSPTGRLLELCAGTGVAALLGARRAERAWATDITERSTQFARWNALLNGLENVTAVRGDLYEPVAGLRFDRIVAHPPYVPAAEQKYVYRDGGEDGEQITKRIVAELPEYLAPGGRLYLTCVATDRVDAPLERRLYELLGDAAAKFDVFLLTGASWHPSEYYCRLAVRGRMSFEEAEQRHLVMRALRVERLVYSTVIIERHAAPRRGVVVRRQMADSARNAEYETVVRWEQAAENEAMLAGLLDARPRLSPLAQLRTVHAPEGGTWAVASCAIATEAPVVFATDCSLEMAELVLGFDGATTVRERLAELRAAERIGPEVGDRDFAELVRTLAASGVLQMPERTPGGRAGEPSRAGRVHVP